MLGFIAASTVLLPHHRSFSPPLNIDFRGRGEECAIFLSKIVLSWGFQGSGNKRKAYGVASLRADRLPLFLLEDDTSGISSNILSYSLKMTRNGCFFIYQTNPALNVKIASKSP